MMFKTSTNFCLECIRKIFLCIWLSTHVVVANFQGEPTCSKFHYEEQTLKSVVRLEFQMENLKSELEDNQKLTNNILDNVKESQRNHTEDVEEMIDNKLQDLEKKLERRMESLKIEKGISKYISFTATTPFSMNPIAGDTIIFTRTMYNSAQLYDTTNGKFKVLVTGTYLFNVQLCLSPGFKFVHYAIMADSRELTHTLLYDAEQRFCNSATAIARLAKDESVYVKVTSTSGQALRDTFNEWNTFSGVLLTME